MPGELLGDHRVGGVLDRARHELMADGVPGQSHASAEIHARPPKKPAPHPPEASHAPAALGAEHAPLGPSLTLNSPLHTFAHQSLTACVDALHFAGGLSRLRA